MADVCDAFQKHIAQQHVLHIQNQHHFHASIAGICSTNQTIAFSTTRKVELDHPQLVEPDNQATTVKN